MKPTIFLSTALLLTISTFANPALANESFLQSVTFQTDSKTATLASTKINAEERKRLRLKRVEEANLYRSKRIIERREKEKKRRAAQVLSQSKQNANQMDNNTLKTDSAKELIN